MLGSVRAGGDWFSAGFGRGRRRAARPQCTDTPTSRHAAATARACRDPRPKRASAARTVAVPKVANVAAAGSVGEVSTSYQTAPAPSHDVPPIPVAAS